MKNGVKTLFIPNKPNPFTKVNDKTRNKPMLKNTMLSALETV